MIKVRFTLLLLFGFVLYSCTYSFTYNNISWLLDWYVDDYIDLTSKQEKLLKLQIKKWQDWHRKEELQKYKVQLTQLKEKLQNKPLSSEQWLEESDKVREHLFRLRDKVSLDIANLAKDLSKEQIDDFFTVLEKKDKNKTKKYEKLSDDLKRKKREDKIEDKVEEYIGSLTKEQKKVLQEYSNQVIPTFTEKMIYNNKLRMKAKELFLNRDKANFSKTMSSLIQAPQKYKSAELLESTAKNRILYSQLAAKINSKLTEKQKEKLLKKIQHLIEVISKIMND